MKVLLVVHGFPPELTGGTELVVATDAAALARADPSSAIEAPPPAAGRSPPARASFRRSRDAVAPAELGRIILSTRRIGNLALRAAFNGAQGRRKRERLQLPGIDSSGGAARHSLAGGRNRRAR